jgi:hypothetical protein
VLLYHLFYSSDSVRSDVCSSTSSILPVHTHRDVGHSHTLMHDLWTWLSRMLMQQEIYKKDKATRINTHCLTANCHSLNNKQTSNSKQNGKHTARMWHVYQEECTSQPHIDKWDWQFKAGQESLEYDEPRDIPVIAQSDNTIAHVKNIICTDRQIVANADNVGVSHETCQRIHKRCVCPHGSKNCTKDDWMKQLQ